MATLLKVDHIRKQYDDDVILQDVSFSLARGQTLAITGQSGCGKTTLLSILGLLQRPTAGSVSVDGHDAGSLDSKRRAKIRADYFGFVFQRSRLVHSLTALENVMVPAWISRSGQALHTRARELLIGFGLEHRLDYRPHELSLGQLRRVALARALLLRPKLLLADEPTNDLDPLLAGEVADNLLAVRDSGSAVIIVTHDPDLAARTDVILQLDQGRLLPAGELSAAPACH